MIGDPAPPSGREAPAAGLPFEPGSTSELLAASHLFTVVVLALDATPWARGDDGLDHRRLALALRLDKSLKRGLALPPGATFRLEVEQRREPGHRVSDYHGFWSHARPAAGASYLVVARGATATPAELMQEPAIQQLEDAALAREVAWTVAAEQAYAGGLRSPEAPERSAAAHRLLAAAVRDRAGLRGPATRYLWARLRPVYGEAEDELFPAVVSLLAAPDATPELRQSLLYDLYMTVLLLGPTPERCRRLLPPLFALLLLPEAAPLHDYLLQVPLYNLLFRPDRAAPAPADVLPPGLDRGRLREVAGSFASPRAQEIVAWLGSR